jgi:predicted TPR repeat methyltransferase
MTQAARAASHSAYAASYDEQVGTCGCWLAEALFGLCCPHVEPEQHLLDLGIGTGLAAQPFARAGLVVHGIDFSAEMVEICRAKGFAASVQQGDLESIPWPYPDQAFDIAICCGVLHFIPSLEPLFQEARRVLRPGGILAFTTKDPAPGVERVEMLAADGFDVYSHAPAWTSACLARAGFSCFKSMQCLVGPELFTLWVAQVAGSALL